MFAAPRGRALWVVVLSLLAIVTFLTFSYRSGQIPISIDQVKYHVGFGDPTYHPDESTQVKSKIGLSNPAYNPDEFAEYNENAHTLPDADSFLPHFNALTKQKGMTFAEAESGCTYPDKDDGTVNFQYSSDTDWVVNKRNDKELEERRQEWHEFIRHGLLPWRDQFMHFNGRGIVILGGNGKSMMRLLVTLRALDRVGCKLPVEIHYWQDELGDNERKEMLKVKPNLYFHDLGGPHNVLPTYKSAIANFHFKIAAIINSRFAEPMLIDSDNIPIVNPELLYDSDTYKEYGTIFWPDIARTRKQNPIWAISNTRCRMDEWEQESGQLLIDKTKFFYHLQLAYWWAAEQRIYYFSFLLGDKDMFRFAWHALKTKFGVPGRWITSVGTYREEDESYCGHTFAQHHPDTGEVVFMHGGLLKSITDDKINWVRDGRGGIFQVYKRSKYDQDKYANERVGMTWEFANDIVPETNPGWRLAVCTQFYDVPIRPLDDIAPGMEKRFESLGGYWMLEVPDRPGNHL